MSFEWKLNHDYRTRDGRRRRMVAMLDDGMPVMASVGAWGKTGGSFVYLVDRGGHYSPNRFEADHDIVDVWKEPVRTRVYLIRSRWNVGVARYV